MSLSDEDLDRYARHVIIPDVGAAGQERLLAASVLVVGSKTGVDAAGIYLRASGVTVADEHSGHEADCVVAAGLSELPAIQADALFAAAKPVVWYDVHGPGFSAGVCLHAGQAVPELPRAKDAPASEHTAVHAVAASEAAAVALALLLGWKLDTCTREVELA